MRAPIGMRIRNRRKTLRLSQAGLARTIGISASYLNLIEANKRDVGGSLLRRIADALDLGIEQLTGEAEQRLIETIEEAFADPVLESVPLDAGRARELVAQFPDAAAALARLHRAYADASAVAEAYANRLRVDPMFSELLHQILSQITAVRSSAEILEDIPDVSEEQRRRFLGSIARESRAMSDVAQTLIGNFDQSIGDRRSISPARELDDMLIAEKNYFPVLEDASNVLRREIEVYGRFSEEGLVNALRKRFSVTVVRGGEREDGRGAFPAQYLYEPTERVMWFQGSTTAATRQFQLARLYAELAAPDVLEEHARDKRLTSQDARRLAYRAMGTYLAGAVVLPYGAVLARAAENKYDLDDLSQYFTASFEQVAHRLVTLRRPGEEGIPFGFLRSDPAGRLTKHFPLPGLLLPSTGHACPLWAIYAAFRMPGQAVRQVVRFADGSRYLFVAKTVSKRLATYRDQPFHSSVMLATDILHADRTVYGSGLNLNDLAADVPVGPACRLCVRRDCVHRQEEALGLSGGEETTMRAPLVPRAAP